VKTASGARAVQIVGDHTITAADPLSDDLRNTLDRIHHSPGAH
jgi:hypothetical protein